MRVSNGKETFEVDESRLPEAQADGFKPLVQVTNGKDTFDVHPDDLGQAKADGFRPVGGALETLQDTGRGVLQGATLGFGDEIAGGLGAAGQAIKKLSLSDVVSDYVSNRDSERKANEEAKTRSPIAYGTGQVGGAVASSLVAPGAGAAKIAAMGAAEGLGSSNADLTTGKGAFDAALDTAKGGATGFIAGKAGELLAPAGNAVKTGLEEVATNPTLSKVAAVNPAGRVVDAITKRLGLPLAEIPGADTTAGKIATRVAGNFVPGAQYVQKVSDAAAVVQKGAAIAVDTIDKIAPMLGKYGPVLQQAAQRGSSSLATTNFLLQQTDPEYQEKLKAISAGN